MKLKAKNAIDANQDLENSNQDLAYLAIGMMHSVINQNRKASYAANYNQSRMVKKQQIRTYKLTERTTTFNVGELRELLAAKASVQP